MKVIGIFLTVFLASPILAAPAVVKCKVTKITPETTPNFLVPSIMAPREGDEITIDLNADVLDELHFTDGRAIPLKEVGAQLERAGFSEFRTYFLGTHRSPTSLYTGSIVIDHPPLNSPITGLIQVHKARHMGFQDLYTMRLDCEEV